MKRKYVYAMRIYLKDGHKPTADLAIMENGEIVGVDEGIAWDCSNERNKYYVNAYTIIYDERAVGSFDSYVKGRMIVSSVLK